MADTPISCLRCGARPPDGAAFCVECGARIPPVPATGEIGSTLTSKGNVSHTVVMEATSTEPTRTKSRRAQSRPSLPTAAMPMPELGGPTATSEGLRDVILDQIARETDASGAQTVRIPTEDGKGKPKKKAAPPLPARAPEPPAPPPPPPAPAAAPAPTPKDELDFGLDDIESSFDALLSEPPAQDASQPTTGEMVEVQALFKQIAANYLGPVRDFMVELGLGSPSKEWLGLCVPAVQSLQKSAQSMGLDELSRALERLATAFDEVERLPGSLIGDVARHVIENAHQDLARLLPEAFAIAEERDRREPIIVQTLLKQVPELRKVALDKIYAAGITRLEMFYVARPQDLVEATGLTPRMCRQIVERFQRFRTEGGSPAGDARAQQHTRLGELVSQLDLQTTDFERALSGDKGLDKRRLRKERADTLLEIQLMLARSGRVDLVRELEKLPFVKKVEVLVKYLEDLKRAAGSGG